MKSDSRHIVVTLFLSAFPIFIFFFEISFFFLINCHRQNFTAPIRLFSHTFYFSVRVFAALLRTFQRLIGPKTIGCLFLPGLQLPEANGHQAAVLLLCFSDSYRAKTVRITGVAPARALERSVRLKQSFPHWDHAPVPGLFEDRLPVPAEAYLQLCSAVSEASSDDGTAPPSAGNTMQRTRVLRVEEIVRLSWLFFNTCTAIPSVSH